MATAIKKSLLDFLPRFERSAWIRFFAGLGGLLVALIAAMYSTVFRENGNLIATAIAVAW